MLLRALFLSLIVIARSNENSQKQTNLDCTGRPYFNVTLTAYYADYISDDERDYLDANGKKLRNLQDFIDGRGEFVTVAMDEILKLAYGATVCVPELNKHFGRMIVLQVRDHGMNLKGRGYSRLDICVRAEPDSYDLAVNRLVTMYIQD